MKTVIHLGHLWKLADHIDQNYNQNPSYPTILSAVECALYVYSSIIQLPNRKKRLEEVLDNHKIITTSDLLLQNPPIALSFKPAEWDEESSCKVIKGYQTLDHTADFLSSYCRFLNNEYYCFFTPITSFPEVKAWSEISPVGGSLCLTILNSTFADLKKFHHEVQILSTPIPIHWKSDDPVTLNETFPLNPQNVRKYF